MYKFLTGFQNLKHYANMSKGVTYDRIWQVVRQVGLEDRIHDKVKTYSLGMRQRLGIAQAMLRNPDVIILDEPTNGLDPAGIHELRDYLRNLAANEGIAVIVSSHLLSEMELMCDRVAIIQSGKLVDVQSVRNEATNDAVEQPVTIEVDDIEAASAVLAEAFSAVEVTTETSTLRLHLTRQQVPEAIHALDSQNIRIYGVQTRGKTLEETFLEITGGEQT